MAVDICVIGAGYVGLVTSACLAYLGNQVIAVDADNSRIASLQEGHMPFFEPGLSRAGYKYAKAGLIRIHN